MGQEAFRVTLKKNKSQCMQENKKLFITLQLDLLAPQFTIS